MTDTRPWLPYLLREMAEAFDLRTALRFSELWGGRYLHLPAEARPDHPVAQALGVPVLQWLIDRHDRLQRVAVPKGCHQDRAQMAVLMRRLMARGDTADEIAAATGLTVRQVHRWRAKARAEEGARQMDLFAPQKAG